MISTIAQIGGTGKGGAGLGTFKGIGPLGLEGGQDPFAVLGSALSGILTFLLIIGALWFLIQILLGGIGWIASGGDKAKIEAARGRITSALIGIVIIFSIMAIAKVVEGVFGIKITTLDIPGP